MLSMAVVAVLILISQGPHLYLLNKIQIDCVTLGPFDYDINNSYSVSYTHLDVYKRQIQEYI